MTEEVSGEKNVELGEISDFATDLNERAKQGKIDPVIGPEHNESQTSAGGTVVRN